MPTLQLTWNAYTTVKVPKDIAKYLKNNPDKMHVRWNTLYYTCEKGMTHSLDGNDNYDVEFKRPESAEWVDEYDSEESESESEEEEDSESDAESKD
jgi:hypothetical protein